MAQPLSGRNPLSYLGVEAITPPNMIVSPTSPTPTDTKNVSVGDMWVNRNTQNFYVLTSLSGGRATWTQIEGSAANQFETDDSNIAVPIGGLLVIHGGTGITTSSSGNVVTITATSLPETVTYVNTSPYVVQPTDFLLDVDSSGGPITIELPDVPAEGKSVIIKDLTGSAASNNITVTTVSGSTLIDGSASFTIANNYLSIETTGNSQGAYDIALGYTPLSASSITFEGDVGSTTPQAGFISFIGNLGGQTLQFRASTPGELDLITSNQIPHNTILGGGGNVGSGLNDATNNTGLGWLNLSNIHNSSSNTAIGFSALANIDFGTIGTSGSFNCAVGDSSLTNLVGGGYNCALGYQSGINLTGNESSNVYINNNGTLGESTTLRIGSATGTGLQNLNRAFICGIQGVNVGAVASVVSISGDQLGSTTITAGSGITVTPGSNSITIAASGTGGVTTIAGNSSSATGSTVTITTGSSNANGTALFTGNGASTITFSASDTNNNTAFGNNSLAAGGAGGFNSTYGSISGTSISSGLLNTCIGYNSGNAISSGSENTFLGAATNCSVGGSRNIAIGYQAGNSLSGSENDNILLSSLGVSSVSNVFRVGRGTGTGNYQLNSTFIGGIQGITVTGTPILISSSDQLGIAVSSRRFKSNIQDIGSDSSVIQKLRPVSFVWNQDSASGLKDATTIRQYGLIAEEALEHVPHAVNIGPDGQPININYQDLIGMMINEIQRLNKRIETLEAK